MENKRLFGMLCAVQRKATRINSNVLSESGLSPVQFHVLMMTAGSETNGTPLCQKDVENEINLTSSSVSTMISKLQKDDYLERYSLDNDGRVKYLRLTEKGKAVCLQHKEAIIACDRTIEKALTEEEQNQLKEILQKILNNLETIS